jgi:hypothetical protein
VRYDSRAGLVESRIPGGAGGGEEMYSDNAVIRPRRTEYRCKVTSLFVSFGLVEDVPIWHGPIV